LLFEIWIFVFIKVNIIFNQRNRKVLNFFTLSYGQFIMLHQLAANYRKVSAKWTCIHTSIIYVMTWCFHTAHLLFLLSDYSIIIVVFKNKLCCAWNRHSFFIFQISIILHKTLSTIIILNFLLSFKIALKLSCWWRENFSRKFKIFSSKLIRLYWNSLLLNI